jgi:hypothetical protein
MAPTQMTVLNQANSGDVYAALAALKKTPADDATSIVSVFILDTTSTTQSVRLDSFMYAVSSEPLGEHHHAVLIAIVSDLTASPAQRTANFSIVFDTAWGQVFADELVPRTLGTRLLQCSLLEELEKDVLLHQILQPELVIALVLEKDNLTTLCQSLSSSATSVLSNVEAIKQLFSFDTPLRQQIIEVIRENTKLAEVPFEKWGKIAFQKAKFSSDSLRATYLNYLGEYLIRVLVQLLGILMQFDSLQLAERPEMMNIISNLMKSVEIVPRCDIDNCLTLAPLSMTRSGDVESRSGLFLFPKMSRTSPGKPSTVLFPLSPFIVKHTFKMGFDVDAIATFFNSIGLDKLTSELRDKYFHDAICVGTAVSQARLSLLKKIVHIFHPATFESVINFHCFVAEHTEWFKAVMTFSMDDFSEASVAVFEGKTVAELVQLAAVDGIVPFHRVDILCAVTRNDDNIDWRLIRAIAMIDSANSRTDQEKEHERGILMQLRNKFQISEVEGVTFLLLAAPYHFIKYFFFELFSKNTEKEELIEKTLSNLAKRADLRHLLDKHEDLQCGIAFLLRKALAIILQQHEPEKCPLFNTFSEFILAGTPHYVLASHCIFDAIYANNILGDLNEAFISKFEAHTPLCYFVRVSLAVSILMLISEPEMPTEDAVTYHDLLRQILQDNQEDIRQVTLFILRAHSSGGTVDVEKAVAEVRKAKYPPMISSCPVIDQVSRALQKVSPLACFRDFVVAVAALGEYAVAKTNDNLARYNALCTEGKIACIGAYCASVAPQPIPNFKAEIYPVVVAQHTPAALTVLQRIANNQTLLSKPEKLRELILSLMVSILNNNNPVVFYKQTVEGILAEKAKLHVHRVAIEDYMVPKCPRCKYLYINILNFTNLILKNKFLC